MYEHEYGAYVCHFSEFGHQRYFKIPPFSSVECHLKRLFDGFIHPGTSVSFYFRGIVWFIDSTMRLQHCILLGLLFMAFQGFAQPEPCIDPVMTPTCQEACIICDIDGFTGINDSPVQGTAPPGFCTFGVQNIQWIAFIAGSTDLELEVAVSNCQNNVGLQIGIYESLDCSNFNLVSNCENSIPENTTAVFNTNQPLTIGQYYYFVMDGDLGDICNYTVTVTEGSTLVPPLTSSGTVSGPTDLCPGLTAEYATTGITGATDYQWTLDGELVGVGQELEINWPDEGSFELCVTASNVCDTAPASCQTIVVAEIPPTLVSESLCEGDCFDIADTTLCDPGMYEFLYTTPVGCDSLLIVEITNFPVVQTDLDIFICEGDSIFIGGNPYFEAGSFQEVLTTWLGCDSTVNLDLSLIACELEGMIQATATQCFGESSGAFSFSVSNGTPPLSYSWEQLGGSLGGSGMINVLSETVFIDNLPLGTYLVNVSDQFGNDLVLITDVVQPPPLEATETFSDYNGYPVSCSGANDGFLAVQPNGGVPPYSYSWNTTAPDSLIENLTEGFYSVTITDFAGCELILAYQFFDPPPLIFAASGTDPGCDGPNTGIISLDTIYGGVGPYLFDIGSTPGTTTEWSELFEGNYSITATDANDCTIDTSIILTAAEIPEINSDSPYEVDLGDSVQLQLYLNISPDSVSWAPLASLSCLDCLDPYARPTTDLLYPVAVWSEDGCLRTDTLFVRVNDIREVYFPNIFSPDNDGVNDRFYPFAGPAVTRVLHFEVYDRWGEQILLRQNFPPNDPVFGWDGTFRNQPVQQGVYTWYAEIEFIDGVVFLYEGDVTVIR